MLGQIVTKRANNGANLNFEPIHRQGIDTSYQAWILTAGYDQNTPNYVNLNQNGETFHLLPGLSFDATK
jgi:hypothetical protein